MISLLAAVAVAALAAASPADVRLDVPYLPQTDLLCGGAAAAMVFRYWGDSHADASPFEPLVDRRAGGISTSVLVDAIRARHWRAVPFTGTMDLLRDELAAGHPVVLLIGDHPAHYHYVVVVGAGADDVIVHDPEWGPSRVLTNAALTLAWQAAGFWAVDIVPEDGPGKIAKTPAGGAAAGVDEAPPPATAGTNVNAAAALADYAGVRFAAHQWSGAASLAEDALALNPADHYAWDVLGSSRFMMDDLHGALDAWNHIDKPRIDLVAIDGLARARYALVAEALSLEPNTLLTDERFRAAQRRLEQLPDRSNSRIGFRPEPDGFAVVDVVIVEQQTRPKGIAEWVVAAGSTYANQELTATIPGGAGQGSLWTASWRWWANRPRLGLEFAAPQVHGLPGTFRVDAFWAAQTFAEASSVSTGAPVREDQLHGGLRWSNWIDSRWRYELSVGADAWGNGNEANDVGRAVSVGAMLEPHFFNDRLIASASIERWMPLSSAEAFHSMSAGAAFRSSRAPRGFVEMADVGAETASDAAPLSIWPGAGDGHARVFLLRAHPLLHNGIIDGPVFGREIVYGNAQVERWLEGKLSGLAVATFVDTARASGRFFNVPGTPFQVDAGGGLRFRVPFELGTFRVDYAHGIRDGEDAMTWGWEN